MEEVDRFILLAISPCFAAKLGTVPGFFVLKDVLHSEQESNGSSILKACVSYDPIEGS